MGRKLIAIFLSMSLVFLSSCTIKNPLDFSQDDKDMSETSIDTALGVTTDTLNEEMEEFLKLVYTPSKQDDIATGLNIIKKYMTDDIYVRFSSRIGEYRPDYKQSIISYYFNFAKSEDTHDHQEHMYIEFIWKHDGVTDLQAFEFVTNADGKIYRFVHLDGGRLSK